MPVLARSVRKFDEFLEQETAMIDIGSEHFQFLIDFRNSHDVVAQAPGYGRLRALQKQKGWVTLAAHKDCEEIVGRLRGRGRLCNADINEICQDIELYFRKNRVRSLSTDDAGRRSLLPVPLPPIESD